MTKKGEGRTPEEARYMLDANAFDYIVDHHIDPRSVRRLGEIFITDVQHGELLDVPDPRRRKALLDALSAIDPTVRPAFASSALAGVDADGRHGLDRPAPRHAPSNPALGFHGASRKPRRWKDAAIGEVASLEGYLLVTDDKEFRRRASDAGVAVLSCAEAFSGLMAPSSDA